MDKRPYDGRRAAMPNGSPVRRAILACALAAGLVAGCAGQVPLQPQTRVIRSQGLPPQLVAEAVRRALAIRGHQVLREQEGFLLASVGNAEVRITFSPSGYRIEHVNSRGAGYNRDPESGRETIGARYVENVRALARTIDSELEGLNRLVPVPKRSVPFPGRPDVATVKEAVVRALESRHYSISSYADGRVVAELRRGHGRTAEIAIEYDRDGLSVKPLSTAGYYEYGGYISDDYAEQQQALEEQIRDELEEIDEARHEREVEVARARSGAPAGGVGVRGGRLGSNCEEVVVRYGYTQTEADVHCHDDILPACADAVLSHGYDPVDLVHCRGRTDTACVYGELNESGGPVGLTGCQ